MENTRAVGRGLRAVEPAEETRAQNKLFVSHNPEKNSMEGYESVGIPQAARTICGDPIQQVER